MCEVMLDRELKQREESKLMRKNRTKVQNHRRRPFNRIVGSKLKCNIFSLVSKIVPSFHPYVLFFVYTEFDAEGWQPKKSLDLKELISIHLPFIGLDLQYPSC